jgi:hypothetical protein
MASPTTIPIIVFINKEPKFETEITPTTTLSELLTQLSSIYESSPLFESPEYDLSIAFQDEEGDYVRVSSELEWKLYALSTIRDSINIELFITPQRVLQNKFNQAYAHVREFGTGLISSLLAPHGVSSVSDSKFEGEDDLIRLTNDFDDVVQTVVVEEEVAPSTISEDLLLQTEDQSIIDEDQLAEYVEKEDDFELINHSMLLSVVEVEPEQQQQLEPEPVIEQPQVVEEPIVQQQQENVAKYQDELKLLRDMGFADEEKNLPLLEKNQGNVVAVVTSLLSGYNL